MRKSKVRHIVLLDDVVGSGERLRQFLWAFFSNKTIRSWVSGKQVSVSVVCYGFSESQRENLSKDWRVDRIRYRQLLPAGSPLWNCDEQNEVKRICADYARLTKRKWWRYGFNDAFTFIAFEHKIPNTNPAILWARGKEWKPLFPLRPRMINETWPSSIPESEMAASVLLEAGNRPLGEIIRNGLLAGMERDVLVALTLIRRSKRDSVWLERKLGWSPQKVIGVLAFCEQRGWYSQEMGITTSGRKELTRVKKLQKRRSEHDILQENCYYFPVSLRGSRNHS